MKRFIVAQQAPLLAVAIIFCLSPCMASGRATASADDLVIKLDLGRVQLDPGHHKVITRAAIPHKPLEIVDLKTGKPVAAATPLKLTDGRTVTHGQYFAELNKLEKKFNEMGYTLRDRSGGKVVLHQVVHDEKELEDQSHKLTTGHAAFDAARMRRVPTHAELEQRHAEGQKLDAIRLQNVARSLASAPTTTPATIKSVKQWNYLLGSKRLAAAYLKGKIDIKGSKDDVHVSGNASAGGYLLNKDLSVIRATGLIAAPASGKGTCNLHVYVMGQHVINIDKSTDVGTKLTDSKSHSIDLSAQMEFAIGPVPVTARIGARGHAGVRYILAIRPAHASLQVRPFVDARVYAQVGVDLFVASAGAGGEVTLLKDELCFGGDLDLDFDPSKGPILSEHLYAQNEMTMLSGRVYAFVKINYLFGSKEWHHDLLNWKGLHANGYLFNVHNKTPLIPNFVPTSH